MIIIKIDSPNQGNQFQFLDEKDKWVNYIPQINQKALESYQQFKNGQGQNIFKYSVGSNNYELNFGTMKQKNIQYSTERNVKLISESSPQNPPPSTPKSQPIAHTQFKFSYEDQQNQFSPYDADTTQLLDQAFQQDKQQVKISRGGFQYVIDFSRMVQINLQTKKQRKIQVFSPNGVWAWKSDDDRFTQFGDNICKGLTQKYEIFLKDRSQSKVKMTIQGNSYTVDFETMDQINDKTQFRRHIKMFCKEYDKDQDKAVKAMAELKRKLDLQILGILLGGIIGGGSDDDDDDGEDIEFQYKNNNDQWETYGDTQHIKILTQGIAEYKKDNSKYRTQIKIGGKDYLIDFKNHLQINTSTQFTREIRFYNKTSPHGQPQPQPRPRPQLGLASQSLSQQQQTLQLPSNWDPMQPQDNFLKVDLPSSHKEYQVVKQEFDKTMSTNKIIRISRLQNKAIYRKHIQEIHNLFDTQKLQGRKQEYNEQLLWHGTRNQDPAIIYNSVDGEGFNVAFSNPNGYWGQGAYFAQKASYSDDYCYTNSNDNSIFLLCSVSLGTQINYQTTKKQQITVPPLIDDQQPGKGRYDSVQGFTNGSDVFILYSASSRRGYPGYEVEYTNQ